VSDVPPIEVDKERLLHEMLGPAVWARQAALGAWLFDHYKGVVAGGPFQGLRLLPDVSWGIGDNCSKIVGLYEAELHPVLADFAAAPPSAVINIGCAEGYYAVGLARLLPATSVFAFDTDVKAQVICRKTAALNGVAERVVVMGACSPEILAQLVREHPAALLVIDCEGYEMALIDGATLALLGHASLIVECHDFVDPAITSTLTARLAATHVVKVVAEGARDPNQIEPLRALPSLDRWLVVLENRPATMSWIVASPRPGAATV
jgi:precorrin-6B methylase 2